MKIATVCSGIGAPEKALKNLGVKYDLYYFCEFDKYATKSYCAIHDEPESKNLGDLTKVDISTLPTNIDLLVGGTPCFPKDSLVLTDNGYKEIQEIKIGDKVLTHNGKYQKVFDLHQSKNNDIYRLSTQASYDFEATGNHKFLIRNKYYKWDNELKKSVRTFSEPKWVQLKDITLCDYVGIPHNHKSLTITDDKMNRECFWYLVGRYIGDGWTSKWYNPKEKKTVYKTIVCCAFNELEELINKIGNLYKYTIIKDRTVYKLQFANKELTLFLEQFGKGAKNKHLTKSIFDLSLCNLEQFLNGLLDSDGCFTQNTYKITSISKELVLGLGQVINKLYNIPFSIYKTKRPKTKIIENRTINQNDSYTITWKPIGTKTQGFYENGILWLPVRDKVKLTSKEIDVYNLEVEEDNSYTVNNIIVHNCQDFSLAGKRAGGAIDSGTRSSLMWNFVEIIAETKPKVVLWENVPGCLTKKMIDNFNKFISALSENGYKVYNEVLNAKNFGIPQNRKRVFVVAIRKDLNIDFKMPEGYDCGVRLKDILEMEVDKKYYLSEKAVNGMLTTKFKQGAYDVVVQKNDGFCRTLLTRDYKAPKCINTNQLIELTKGQSQGIRVNEDQLLTKNKRLKEMLSKIDVSKIKAIDIYNKSTHDVMHAIKTTVNSANMTAVSTNLAIRKLTPKECYRLMGFSDEDFEKSKNVPTSDAQLYKQAGNSIVVNVLMAIFGQLYNIDWKPLVYGDWWNTEQERMDELPLFQLLKEKINV